MFKDMVPLLDDPVRITKLRTVDQDPKVENLHLRGNCQFKPKQISKNAARMRIYRTKKEVRERERIRDRERKMKKRNQETSEEKEERRKKRRERERLKRSTSVLRKVPETSAVTTSIDPEKVGSQTYVVRIHTEVIHRNIIHHSLRDESSTDGEAQNSTTAIRINEEGRVEKFLIREMH